MGYQYSNPQFNNPIPVPDSANISQPPEDIEFTESNLSILVSDDEPTPDEAQTEDQSP